MAQIHAKEKSLSPLQGFFHPQSFLVIGLVLLSLSAFVLNASQGWILSAYDAQSTLYTARSVHHSLERGIAHLVGSELPLPHLLIVPLLRIKDVEGTLWHKRFVLNVQPRPLPKAFRLLQNYPNPFNPETWIPYQLTEAAAVQIRIYSASGQLVRTLDLGFKPADFYTSRSEAAYWDGRNDIGEQVASGLYFYHLQAGHFSGIRKMLILK